MTAPNHALTGAVIGLSVTNPVLAVAFAFFSHFICDAIPHWDPSGPTHEARISSRVFFWVQIVAGASLCFLLVVLLTVAHPTHWLLGALCAFAAASPDLFYFPRFIHIKRTGKDILEQNRFWRFHNALGWKTGPKWAVIEIEWFVIFSIFLASKL